MYKNAFSSPCIKTINAKHTKITPVHATVIYITLTKFQLDRIERFGAIVFTYVHTHTHIHTYIRHSKNIKMNSGPLKTYEYDKISKLNFFIITALSYIVYVQKVKISRILTR